MHVILSPGTKGTDITRGHEQGVPVTPA